MPLVASEKSNTVALGSLRGNDRLGTKKECEHSDDHQRRHGGISGEPSESRGDSKGASARSQHAQVVAGLGRGGTGALQVERKNFDAPGIDDNILTRGEKSDYGCQNSHRAQVSF